MTPGDETDLPFNAGRAAGEAFAALVLRPSHGAKATRMFYNAVSQGIPADPEGRREWLNGFAIATVMAAGAAVESDTPDAEGVLSQLDDIGAYINCGDTGKALDLLAELRGQFGGDK